MTTEQLRKYHRERRSIAKKLGICCQCNDARAMPARTKCFQCLSTEAARFKDGRYQKAA